jgi:hypothetical protein
MEKPPRDDKPIQLQFRSAGSLICRRVSNNPPNSYSAISPPTRPSHTRPSPKRTFVVTPQCRTTPNFKKSCAQVEIGVTPPRSGGLKPVKKKRRNPLTVRLSDSDRERIRGKASRAGCSLNAYVRASVLGSDYTPPADPELTQALLKLNFELTKQGVNINQVARQLNAGLISPAQAEAMMVILTRSTLQIHKAIREAMAQGKMEE